ncbi:MAG TPA: TonB-dependent receptor [Steroidobacteraceae bacterium]|nr:TonB-dependent receptor [Steroidobacteraceae bacterium]
MKAKHRKYLCAPGALLLAGSVSAPAFAADQAASGAGLEEIVVTAVRQALRDSVILKKNTDLVSDNISTAEIGQLPDVTIAEELNRLPGVNTTRDRGNASQAAVRGLGPRLVLGLVNGREVASSEPSQDLRWEIYPSEILSGAQVYKTQDATLVPGGIAATIDIRTLSPLDYHGPMLTLRAGPTYNQIGKDLPHYDPLGYRGSVGFVDRVSDKFAVSLAASVQKEKNGFPDFRTWGWNTPDTGSPGDINGDGVPENTTWGLNTEVKEITQDRAALAGTAEWRTDGGTTLKADALWSQYEIKENQFQAWFGNNITGNWANGDAFRYTAPGSSYEVLNGTVVAATLANQFANYQSEIARYKERHTLGVFGLNAAFKSDVWSNSVDLSYSEAWRKNRWEAIYLDTVYAPTLVYDVRDGQAPYAATPGFNPADPAIQSVSPGRNGFNDGPEETKDRLTALAADFTRSLESSGMTDFKFGGRLSNREKTHSRSQFNLCAGTGSTCPGTGTISLANAGLEAFTVPGFTAPPMVYGDFDTLKAMVYPDDSVPAGADQPGQRFDVQESTFEVYAKLDFSTALAGKALSGGFGVRVAEMHTTSSGFVTTDGGATYVPVSVDNTYTNYLPSLNMVLHLSNEQLLRFGAGVAIARPPLDALVTGFSISATGIPRTGGGGNPLLLPYRADQVDLSYEWYFHDESLLALAAYYKHMETMIGASQSTQQINGVTAIITSENNTKGGDLHGLEFTFQTRFYFLPGFLRDFGVYANYAYVDSNIHEVAPASNPYPMIGLAKGTSELDLSYSKAGFESRVAWKHHSNFTVAPTWVGTTLKDLAAESILDVSFSYEWASRYGVRLQGHNMTNERGRFTTDNNPQNLANDSGYDVFGRSYLLDFSVRL